MEEVTTPFSKIYDCFLSKITDDMYLELTELDTYKLLQELIIGAIQKFEFPRVNLHENYELMAYEEDVYCGIESNNIETKAFVYTGGCFFCKLNNEEKNILATYMVVEWLGQQLASIDNTRLQYSGSDFKFTSQANHMSKILNVKSNYEREGFHLQRLYKRRKTDENGIMRSTFGSIMGNDV